MEEIEYEPEEVVYVLHLVSGGAPIIGKVEMPWGSRAIVSDPFFLLYYRDDEGKERIQVNDVTAFSKDNSIVIASDHVLYCYEPSEEILGYYNNTLLKSVERIED